MKNPNDTRIGGGQQFIPDIYEAESKLLRFLPKMIKSVADTGLRTKYEQYLSQTEEHLKLIKRLTLAI